jgi:hypothetical protein
MSKEIGRKPQAVNSCGDSTARRREEPEKMENEPVVLVARVMVTLVGAGARARSPNLSRAKPSLVARLYSLFSFCLTFLAAFPLLKTQGKI